MSDSDYEVGYGKPPKHTQFKPGHPGRRRGTRKGPATLSEQLDRILAERVDVNEGGARRRMSKEEVFLRQLVSRSISGDRQASKLLLDYLQHRQAEPGRQDSGATDAFLLGELTKLLDETPREQRDA